MWISLSNFVVNTRYNLASISHGHVASVYIIHNVYFIDIRNYEKFKY